MCTKQQLFSPSWKLWPPLPCKIKEKTQNHLNQPWLLLHFKWNYLSCFCQMSPILQLFWPLMKTTYSKLTLGVYCAIHVHGVVNISIPPGATRLGRRSRNWDGLCNLHSRFAATTQPNCPKSKGKEHASPRWKCVRLRSYIVSRKERNQNYIMSEKGMLWGSGFWLYQNDTNGKLCKVLKYKLLQTCSQFYHEQM